MIPIPIPVKTGIIPESESCITVGNDCKRWANVLVLMHLVIFGYIFGPEMIKLALRACYFSMISCQVKMECVSYMIVCDL